MLDSHKMPTAKSDTKDSQKAIFNRRDDCLSRGGSESISDGRWVFGSWLIVYLVIYSND
jgi:hypothetical protein